MNAKIFCCLSAARDHGRTVCTGLRATAKAETKSRGCRRRARWRGTDHGGSLKSYLYFIAADAMEGRDTPSRGLDITANFIAMNLAKWGFKPAGDDSTYFQKIALRRARLDPDQTHAEFNGRPLKYGDDFLASATAGTASGRMVYVGDGWVIKSKEIDPYKNIDVKDKIIVYTEERCQKE